MKSARPKIKAPGFRNCVGQALLPGCAAKLCSAAKIALPGGAVRQSEDAHRKHELDDAASLRVEIADGSHSLGETTENDRFSHSSSIDETRVPKSDRPPAPEDYFVAPLPDGSPR